MQIAITNRGSNQIQPEIIKQMNNAQRSIWIAVAWFTDREIYNVLIAKLKQGVKIRLIALYDDINQEKGVDFDTLSKNGAEVYLTQDGNLLMHHKYCIIDSQTVIMGSYNYTVAAQSHRESIIVSKHEKQIVTEFEAEFNDILKEYFNKESLIVPKLENQTSIDNQINGSNISTKGHINEECPLTMEWWDGLLQYGHLKPSTSLNKYLEQYTWQDIFLVNLAFWEKGIIFNHTGIKGIGYADCFEVYKGKFETTFNTNPSQITHQKLNRIYQLNSLKLSACRISTLAPLQKLINLQRLDCDKNEIISLEPLQELKNLQELYCDENQITSLEPLQELKNLQILCCYRNKISSLEGLQGCENLQILVCSCNEISSLAPLQGSKKMQKLICWGNKIRSLKPLQELESLEELVCQNNQIRSLEPILEWRNLQKLYCWNNQISDLEVKKFSEEHPNCTVNPFYAMR